MSKCFIDELKKLESYGFQREPDYVLATPELLLTDDAVDHLKKELIQIGFHEKQVPRVTRFIRNILTSARSQILTVNHTPSAEAIRKLHEAGYTVTTVKTTPGKIPAIVSIKTELGSIVVWMSIEELKPIVDIYDWGLPE